MHYSRVRVNIPSSLSRYYHQPVLYHTITWIHRGSAPALHTITQSGYNQTKTRSGFLHFPIKQLYFALSHSNKKNLESLRFNEEQSFQNGQDVKIYLSGLVSAFVSQVWGAGPTHTRHLTLGLALGTTHRSHQHHLSSESESMRKAHTALTLDVLIKL